MWAAQHLTGQDLASLGQAPQREVLGLGPMWGQLHAPPPQAAGEGRPDPGSCPVPVLPNSPALQDSAGRACRLLALVSCGHRTRGPPRGAVSPPGCTQRNSAKRSTGCRPFWFLWRTGLANSPWHSGVPLGAEREPLSLAWDLAAYLLPQAATQSLSARHTGSQWQKGFACGPGPGLLPLPGKPWARLPVLSPPPRAGLGRSPVAVLRSGLGTWSLPTLTPAAGLRAGPWSELVSFPKVALSGKKLWLRRPCRALWLQS